MTIKYIYKGQEVELVPGQQYTSHWNVYYNQPTENGGSRRIIVTAIPGQTLQIVDDTKPASPTTTELDDTIDNQLNINTSSFLVLRKHFPGIGRVAPKKIVENRPDGGYKDFEELKELNKELNINWDELKDKLVFE
jgi:DNA uptake protein ComE-like DNA-binding protein